LKEILLQTLGDPDEVDEYYKYLEDYFADLGADPNATYEYYQEPSYDGPWSKLLASCGGAVIDWINGDHGGVWRIHADGSVSSNEYEETLWKKL
jgi:hypothetical protein